jgi:hypothetical protein
MSINPLHRVNELFDAYAAALASFNAKSMMYYYDLPCSFISDENHSVYTDPTLLEGFFTLGASFYKKEGIAHAKPEVWNKYLWTDKIAKVKLIWHYYDAENELLYSCDYQYIVREIEGEWKIAAAISLNEKQRMEAWLGSK